MNANSDDPSRQGRKPPTPRSRDPGFPEDGQPFDPLAYAHYEEPEPALIRNPYVLAGIAVGVSIFLAIFVVILFGGSKGETSTGPPPSSDNVVIDALTPQATSGVTAKSIAPATVREGPSTDALEIAPLRTGQDVDVVGRNATSSWYEINYPIGSQLQGWVVSSALKLPDGSDAKLAVTVATPIPRPTIAPATPTPTPAATAVPSPAASPTPAGGPDLALTISSCQPGQAMVVTVRNAAGPDAKARQVRITISSQVGVQGIADSLINLDAGASTSLQTNQVVQPGLMMARIDLIGAPPDPNPGNNSAQCAGGAIVPQPGFVPSAPTPQLGR